MRCIYGLTGEKSVKYLERALKSLKLESYKDSTCTDYWKCTESNVKVALKDMIQLAKLCPNGYWTGD
jgi:hypothetical protein